MTSVAVIDSGVANLESVLAALRRLNVDAASTSDAAVIEKASHVVLPGVGAAAPAMEQLRRKNLVPVIRALKQPVIGICLGMQLLFDHLNESGGTDGLGIIPGTIAHLPSTPEMPVPHMGWNTLDVKQPNHPLMKNVPDQSFVYFVHSYAAPISPATLASTDYGVPFTAMVAHNNFHGCQFHPERSSAVGSQILKNFLDL